MVDGQWSIYNVWVTNKKNDSLRAAAATGQLPVRSEALIVRLLEEPELPAIVRRLEAPALTRLIGKIGLEDAGEWLVLATPKQLEQVLDADVWFAERPGEPERFQARRFALWIEVLTQAGPDQALSRLQAMDETFLAMALAKLTRVFDADRLQAYFAALGDDDESEHEAFEKALEGLPQEEFEEYLVVARDENGWDALVDLLTALHERDFALFSRLMRRCVRATAAAAEDEGSYATLLNADEELIEAAAAEREARREREGYVAPQDAKAFLALVRGARRDAVLGEARLDPVVESYLQPLQVTPPSPPGNAQPPPSERADLLAARLTAALAAEARAEDAKAEHALPPAASAGAPSRLRSLMAELRAGDPDRYFACKRELGFLANALVAGDASAGRKRTPSEAAQAVLDTCERGLATMLAHDHTWRPAAERFPMVRLFRLGAAQG